MTAVAEATVWRRAILHVDMDAFFASVEVLDNPSLAGRPLVVGGDVGGHGVVAAASYEARRYGVHSAMPMAMALALCPACVRVDARQARYADVSDTVFDILHRYTSEVEPVSVDEAYLDVIGSLRLFGPPDAIARSIKAAVRTETRLTCSVGVSQSRLVSKIASDLHKPDGLVVVEPGTEAERLAPLAIEKMPGIGPKTAVTLHEMGIHLLGDLAAYPVGALEERFGVYGPALSSRARGDDDGDVGAREGSKSIGAETTLERFTDSAEEIDRTLLSLADQVGRRARAARLAGRRITIKIRDDTFVTRTRARTLRERTDLSREIASTARELYAASPVGGDRKVRLLGITMSELDAPDAGQMTLIPDERRERARRAERVVDEIRNALGHDALTRGALLVPPDDVTGGRKE